MEKTMFDRLVESSRQKQGRRAGGYLLVTSLIYALALVVFIALAVIGFNPVLAGQRSFLAEITLPPAPADPLQVHTTLCRWGPTAPAKIPETILPRIDAGEVRPLNFPPGVISMIPSGGSSLLFVHETAEPTPPPPAPSPTPKIEPVPEAKPDPNTVSEGVLQGSAIKKVKPIYPEIARKSRTGGLVQVQVMISEDGRVMEAFILNGHPLLRYAALEAARQWTFSQTTLSKVPVKVQGVLTFNFMLE
jgi:periplasmic protein TonB